MNALEQEIQQFKEAYLWLTQEFPSLDSDTLQQVAHACMTLEQHNGLATLHFKDKAILLCSDAKNSVPNQEIHNYQLFVSKRPFLKTQAPLCIALINFDLSQEMQKRYPALRDLEAQAKNHDACQYKISSSHCVLAWRTPLQHQLIAALTKTLHQHQLVLKEMVATSTSDQILLLAFEVTGTADLGRCLQQFFTLWCGPISEIIASTFADLGPIPAMAIFIHQALVHADPYLYSFAQIEEDLCRHPELTLLLTGAFAAKFDPQTHNASTYAALKTQFLSEVEKLDTGHEPSDLRRKNILKQGLSFVEFALKTNFYTLNKTGLSFRFDPRYLDHLPYSRSEKFPDLPFAVFMMIGRDYFGFHIRFRDLSRGGLRTVCPQNLEAWKIDRNNIFAECYNLAYTQQKKNKDIPEGGSKGVILLEPSQQLYPAQRSYVESFLTILNCDESGKLRASHIVDTYNKPEYIYLGPDENMHDAMIVWISQYAKLQGYKPGISFMTSKPRTGINHKEFGATSCGVNICMEEVLKFLKIDPQKDPFTIKMSGGPDGDVAGNQMENLFRFYPTTAKLLTTIDISGTVYDPQGLDLATLSDLFHAVKPIRFYPPEKLSEGGFLLDLKTTREAGPHTQETLLVRKKNGKVVEEWLPDNAAHHVLRFTVLQTKADVFIPGGGRPRTLNDTNYQDFFDPSGKPSAKAIIEGANLYLTPAARRALEKLGVLIIKDSSANKGGVTCSSFEVVAGLVLSEDEFFKEKNVLVAEILQIIMARAKDEILTLLKAQGKDFLTDVSDWISQKINQYKDELLSHLTPLKLSNDFNDPFVRCLLNYCPPLLRQKYAQRILDNIPDIHKKAIIACFLAQRAVYTYGLNWTASIVEKLPTLLNDPVIAS
jgi:glutamate dehydrogenase